MMFVLYVHPPSRTSCSTSACFGFVLCVQPPSAPAGAGVCTRRGGSAESGPTATEIPPQACRYTNPSRLLCRVLRQLGNGNVVDGMYAAKDDSVHDKDIVHALTPSTVSGVDVTMVRRELKGLPPKSRKIDLACMYRTGATGSLSEVRTCGGCVLAVVVRGPRRRHRLARRGAEPRLLRTSDRMSSL